MVGSKKGKLLVAAANLMDPNFLRTVIYLIDHNEEGTAGLVLNRPSETNVHEIIPDWTLPLGDPGLVFLGGPVEMDSVTCLAQAAEQTDGLAHVSQDCYLVDLSLDLDLINATNSRAYAGYAGWSNGQLEAEIEEGSWFIVEMQPSDIFTPNPSGLWKEVLNRQGGFIAMHANAPIDFRNN